MYVSVRLHACKHVHNVHMHVYILVYMHTIHGVYIGGPVCVI